MSIGLENFLPQIIAASADYPFGDIKDNTGPGDGTNIDRFNHADYHQTWRKILALAAVVPNGLPDNVTNGYQYITALNRLFKKFTGVFNDPTNPTFTLTAAHVGKMINIAGNTATKSFNLPNSNTLQDGDSFTFYNNAPYIAIIQSGTDFVNTGSNVTLKSEGDFVELVLDKANNNWVITQYKFTDPFIINIITVGSGGGAPAFQNSWLANSPMKFFIDDKDFVHLNGIVHKTGAISGSTNLIFTLPAGYRPATPFTIWVWYYDSGTVGQVPLNILANGDVTIDQTQLSVFGDTIVRIQAIHFYKNW